MGSFIEIAVTIVASVVISLVYSWSLTLVILGLVPLLVVSQGVQAKVKAGTTGSVKKSYEESSNVRFVRYNNLSSVKLLVQTTLYLKLKLTADKNINELDDVK